MKKLILALIALFSFSLQAQDVIKTNKGDVKIHPILHGTLALEYNDMTIYVDPYGGAEGFSGLNDADLILITDIHGDHLNPKTLNSLNTSDSHFIVPQAVAKQMEGIDNKAIEVLDNGKATQFKGINIKAIPMYNLPESDDAKHTKGRGNGYILSIANKTIYISGDTEDIVEMRALKNIDVAFVCMNLPYTMDVESAADAVSEFKPAIVYPYHYRGSDGLSDVDKFKSIVNDNAKKVEVRLRNWYPSN